MNSKWYPIVEKFLINSRSKSEKKSLEKQLIGINAYIKNYVHSDLLNLTEA